jgi:hypothetical protein
MFRMDLLSIIRSLNSEYTAVGILRIVSSCLFVCLSARMYQLRSRWTDVNEIWHLSIFRTSVEEIRVSLQYYKINGYFTRRPVYMYKISLDSC